VRRHKELNMEIRKTGTEGIGSEEMNQELRNRMGQ
jgi:hypothetical protein